MIQNVTVYCASSRTLAAKYCDAAVALGRAIAQQGWGVIYGGDSLGLMGCVSEGAAGAGGRVIGILTEKFVELGIRDERCHEVVVARDMRHRKEILESRGDAMIALPGGLGTLEEFFEIVVGRQLGYHKKPIVLLNIAGYYQPLLKMIEHGIELKFIKAISRDLFHVAEGVEDAVEYLSKIRIE
jgi:hypothetical protein